ncbi:hypothetical protein LJB92_04500 [Bacteroidales bacterium OttesenSCG-928-M06]|nr:hypothetical protein [Bacteroidales bacterium OttesenSCG-928-M06]
MSCSCYSKKHVYVPIDKEPPPFSIDFKVIYKDSNDTICFNDSLEFNISITNQTDSVIDFRCNLRLTHVYDNDYNIIEGFYCGLLTSMWLGDNPHGDPTTILPRDTYSRKYKVKAIKDLFLAEGKNKIQMEFISSKYLTVFSDPIQIIVLNCY